MTSRLGVLWQETRTLLRDALDFAHRWRRRLLAGLAIVAAMGACAWPWDAPIAVLARDRISPQMRRWAGHVRRWGAFNDTMTFVLVTWGIGRLRRTPRWQRAALAALLATAVAGIAVNSLRVTLGRPRPRAGLPDRFTGPSLSWKRQSFPSGHSGASFASATALAIAVPPIGGVALVSASAVAAASVANRSHYLSDVLVGTGCGILLGVVFGFAARGRPLPPPQ